MIVQAWARCARTPMGAAAVRQLAPLRTAASVREAHDAVAEWLLLEDQQVDTGLSGVSDIAPLTERASKGEVLEDDDLRQAGSALDALVRVRKTLDAHAEDLPLLSALAAEIDLDPEVAASLRTAWDATGALSAERWPQLGTLRERIAALEDRIRTTLDHLVSSEALADDLQDRFWTQRDSRYVLPLKHHAKGMGIVHGTSRTGQTVFVEPHQIVSLNNDIRMAEGELAAEEHRIRGQLSSRLGQQHPAIGTALEAAVGLDLTAARAGLAIRLDAVRPQVGDGGRVELHQARHPVLVLRGVEVVANDLRLTADRPALVISGPNAGGKTVALKTVGLCALLVQHGGYVPAAEGSRVDWFGQVFAVIGDQQTVEEDLSSFSGHLAALQRGLQTAGPSTLALLDELSTGTDPAQGAALAQAVLERFLERGARLVVTTHFARLKGLAASDPRFAIAATRFGDGRPTYQLVEGATGESRALELARSMGLEAALLSRAEALLDDGEAALQRTLETLDAERDRVSARAAELAQVSTDLDQRQAKIKAQEDRISQQSKALEEAGARAYLDRLRQAERAIGDVVAELQRDPSHKAVRAARASIDALRALAPTPPQPASAPAQVATGDRVRLTRVGKEGVVEGVKPRSVQVRAGGLLLTVRPEDLVKLDAPPAPSAPRPLPTGRRRRPALHDAVRVGNNVLDLRGMRVEEGLEACERFFDQAVLRGADTVFLLHGHGTGALKAGLRGALGQSDYVAAWAPASEEQGGDAFTVVELA